MAASHRHRQQQPSRAREGASKCLPIRAPNRQADQQSGGLKPTNLTHQPGLDDLVEPPDHRDRRQPAPKPVRDHFEEPDGHSPGAS